MWLTELLRDEEIRPTRPTMENNVGRRQSIEFTRISDISDTSDIKTTQTRLSEETRGGSQKFCDLTCPYREVLTLPLPDGGKEETPGCVNPRITPGIDTWRPLSRLNGCPAKWSNKIKK